MVDRLIVEVAIAEDPSGKGSVEKEGERGAPVEAEVSVDGVSIRDGSVDDDSAVDDDSSMDDDSSVVDDSSIVDGSVGDGTTDNVTDNSVDKASVIEVSIEATEDKASVKDSAGDSVDEASTDEESVDRSSEDETWVTDGFMDGCSVKVGSADAELMIKESVDDGSEDKVSELIIIIDDSEYEASVDKETSSEVCVGGGSVGDDSVDFSVIKESVDEEACIDDEAWVVERSADGAYVVDSSVDEGPVEEEPVDMRSVTDTLGGYSLEEASVSDTNVSEEL